MPFPPRDTDPRTGLPWQLPKATRGQLIKVPELPVLTDGTPISQVNAAYRSSPELATNDSNIFLDTPDPISNLPAKAAACPPGWVEIEDYSENWGLKNQEVTRTFQGLGRLDKPSFNGRSATA